MADFDQNHGIHSTTTTPTTRPVAVDDDSSRKIAAATSSGENHPTSESDKNESANATNNDETASKIDAFLRSRLGVRHRPATCKHEGCINQVVRSGVCGKHCSHEKCIKIAQKKGGLCWLHEVESCSGVNFMFEPETKRQRTSKGVFDDSNNDAGHEAKEQRNSTTTKMTPAQESTYWGTHRDALKAYIQQHGHPPQARDENPPLYDWLQVQKSRQSDIENLCNSC